MGLFGCKACEAKDDEIVWLRATLEHERKLRAEMDVPGISRRVESAPPTPAEHVPEPKRDHEPTFPGYERYETPKAEVT